MQKCIVGMPYLMGNGLHCMLGKNIPGSHMSTLTLLTLLNTPAVVC